MIHRKVILLVGVSLTIVGGSHLISRGAPNFLRPGSLSIGLEDSLPGPRVKTAEELIEFWRGRFERDPRDFISLTFLGQAFIRKARETGDISAYERAEAALRRALDLNPNYESTLAYLATVLFAKHDFQGALDLADRVYSFDPRALQALATLGDAHLELGNYLEAEAAYRQLLDRSPSSPVYSRLARLAWLRGRPEEALDLMQQAADEAKESGLSGENTAWYQVQLGELYFTTGRYPEAAEYYAAALGAFDNYYLALAGLGKVRAAQGHYAEAIAFYRQTIAIIPQPEFVAALGDIYAITGQASQAQQEYRLVEYIGKLAAINQIIYNRRLALFYADHDVKLEEALELAARELEVRQDIYGYDALAWALYKNGRYAQAAEAIAEAMQLGTRDALLYYHAGMIYAGLGDHQGARRMLTEALSINPRFDPLQSRIAALTLQQINAALPRSLSSSRIALDKWSGNPRWLK
ncbi:MAG: tetratricopeptide repeat protein [Chloroflexi bacterium]|nr:tetratricopeptide repeat protein [Chloroflexota bacterium]